MPAGVLAEEGAELEVLLDGQAGEDAGGPRGSGRGPARRSCGRATPSSRSPSNEISPATGLSRPEMVRSVVVLPAPLVPMRVTTWPSSTVKLMPLTASILP